MIVLTKSARPKLPPVPARVEMQFDNEQDLLAKMREMAARESLAAMRRDGTIYCDNMRTLHQESGRLGALASKSARRKRELADPNSKYNQIIAALKANGKMTASEIGAVIGLSPKAVHARLRRMEGLQVRASGRKLCENGAFAIGWALK